MVRLAIRAAKDHRDAKRRRKAEGEVSIPEEDLVAESDDHAGSTSSLDSLPPLHKAENRYTVKEVHDEELRKQREVKGILNKLTTENFEKLAQQILDVNIDSYDGLKHLIGQIFEKSLSEATFCALYAQLCKHIRNEFPEFKEDGQSYFLRVLLWMCQEEYKWGDRGVREAEAIEVSDYEEVEGEEGAMKRKQLTPLEVRRKKEEREDKIRVAKRRMLGNIRFMGELYKHGTPLARADAGILTEKIMHSCIEEMLASIGSSSLEDIEALCTLLETIGEQLDRDARRHMDRYIQRMGLLSQRGDVPSTIKSTLRGVIDLRNNNWRARREA